MGGATELIYEPSDGITKTAFRISSTIIPMVVGGPEFWFFLAFNIAIFVSRKTGWFKPEDYDIVLPWELTGVTGSLMTFFVVFYNNHVFARYNKIHDLTKRMSENCLELISMLKVQLPSRHIQRKAARLIISSCFMFFFERTEPEKDDKDDDEGSEKEGHSVSRKELEQLQKLGFLTASEIAHLEKYCETTGKHAIPSFLVLQWGIELIRKTTPNPLDHGDMLFFFYGKCYQVRANQAEVVQMMELPMPFQYFHVMNLMLLLNLFLWGYSLGCEDSLFAPLIFAFLQLMFQGIRFLSTALSDPFGDDEVDFPVNDWMIQLYSRMYGILEDQWDVTDRSKTSFDRQEPLKEVALVKNIVDMNVDLHTQRTKDAGSPSSGSATPLVTAPKTRSLSISPAGVSPPVPITRSMSIAAGGDRSAPSNLMSPPGQSPPWWQKYLPAQLVQNQPPAYTRLPTNPPPQEIHANSAGPVAQISQALRVLTPRWTQQDGARSVPPPGYSTQHVQQRAPQQASAPRQPQQQAPSQTLAPSNRVSLASRSPSHDVQRDAPTPTQNLSPPVEPPRETQVTPPQPSAPPQAQPGQFLPPEVLYPEPPAMQSRWS